MRKVAWVEGKRGHRVAGSLLAAQQGISSLGKKHTQAPYRDGEKDDRVLLVEPDLNHFDPIVIHHDGVWE